MSTPPFPLIRMQGPAHDRGRQYGSQARKLIHQVIDFYRGMFQTKSNLDWDASLAKAREFIPFMQAYDAEIMEEMEGIARGAERSLEEILALNVRSELLFLLTAQGDPAPPGCTSLAVRPGPAGAGPMLLAQNWDWYPAVRDLCVMLQIQPQGRPDIIQVVEAGLIAKTGFNSAGIGLCTNALVSAGWRVGVPFHAILRRILSAATMAEAIGAVTQPPRASSGSYLIGHAEGEAICIEAAPRALNYIFPAQGIITHSNHYKVYHPQINDLVPSLWPDSIMRDHRAAKMLAAGPRPIGVRRIKQVLRDHFDRPYSICAHPDAAHPLEERCHTNFSIIMDLTAQTLYLAPGPPCAREYVRIDCPGMQVVP
ncbi:MAG: hypothetical protein JSW39_26280 [Desulfobacterales bacterium]|nr:MAG: hypothetical protein JSW39_26280 [Desulfobacterales bacterium]